MQRPENVYVHMHASLRHCIEPFLRRLAEGRSESACQILRILRSGYSALELAAGEGHDLIVLKLLMHGADGNGFPFPEDPDDCVSY